LAKAAYPEGWRRVRHRVFPVNLPNSITLARISCVPLFLWILSSTGSHAPHVRQELLAAAVFLLASLTDGVDGYLARRTHQVTTLGTLLSALADKLLVSTAYIALVRFAPGLVPAWIAVLIVGREFMVTGLSAVAVQEHMRPVRDIGKGKTVLQTISVLAVLLAHGWPRWQVGGTVLPGVAIAVSALWMTLAVSLFSACAYFRSFWMEAMQQSRQRRAPLPFAAKRSGDPDVSA
jgi:CDP-diacylglycerol---glycerol-3-phosphate 3-phosphatidyltransferase